MGLGLDSEGNPRSPPPVECGRCGRSNPSHVRYCLDCGSVLPDKTPIREPSGPGGLQRLKVDEAPEGAGDRPTPVGEPGRVNCTHCGIDNPLGASFCRDCGSRLTVAQPSALPQPPDAPPEPASSKPAIEAPVPEALGTLASAQPSPLADPPTPAPQAKRALRDATKPSAGIEAVAVAEDLGRKSCPACGAGNNAAARFCQLCGTPFDRLSGVSPAVRPSGPPMPEADLVVIAQDGSPGRRYPLSGSRNMIGNGEADINLRKDPYVSPVHAEVGYRNGRFYLADRGSLNGVFVRLGGSIPLTSGDLLLVGLGVLRFEIVEEAERNLAPQTRNGTRVFGTPPAPRYARLTTQTVEGVSRDRYYLSRAETVLGREVGDIVFTDDPFMSRRHAAIRRDPSTNTFTIRDLGSSNGTFVALREEHALSPGDHVRIGQHLFRLDVRSNG